MIWEYQKLRFYIGFRNVGGLEFVISLTLGGQYFIVGSDPAVLQWTVDLEFLDG